MSRIQQYDGNLSRRYLLAASSLVVWWIVVFPSAVLVYSVNEKHVYDRQHVFLSYSGFPLLVSVLSCLLIWSVKSKWITTTSISAFITPLLAGGISIIVSKLIKLILLYTTIGLKYEYFNNINPTIIMFWAGVIAGAFRWISALPTGNSLNINQLRALLIWATWISWSIDNAVKYNLISILIHNQNASFSFIFNSISVALPVMMVFVLLHTLFIKKSIWVQITISIIIAVLQQVLSCLLIYGIGVKSRLFLWSNGVALWYVLDPVYPILWVILVCNLTSKRKSVV